MLLSGRAESKEGGWRLIAFSLNVIENKSIATMALLTIGE
jgi:hypothetical protein